MAKKLEKIIVNGTAHINTGAIAKKIHKRVTAKKISSNAATISTENGFSEEEARKCAIAIGGIFNGRFIKVMN